MGCSLITYFTEKNKMTTQNEIKKPSSRCCSLCISPTLSLNETCETMYSAKYGGRSGRAKGKAPKSKKKQCPICDAKGHDETDCPKKDEEIQSNRPQLGFGRTHKASRKANRSDSSVSQNTNGDDDNNTSLTLESVFDIATVEEDPFFFFDASCDVGASIDSLATLQNSSKKAKSTYQAALEGYKQMYGGCICRQLLKPERPWNGDAPRIKDILDTDPHVFFVVGLGPGFLIHSHDDHDHDHDHDHDDDDDDDDDDDESQDSNKDDKDVQDATHAKENDEAVLALSDAIEHDDRVVGVFSKLDYSSNVLNRPGHDRETQLCRFKATCTAAIQSNVPIQCRIAPGAGAKKGTQDDDAHVLVMRDLAQVLLEMTPTESSSSNLLMVHLVSWNGTSEHMSTMLKAFPDTLYVGMNAAVGFTKATLAQECAFEVPLNRLLLETDAPNTIPSPVVSSNGRKAFCHSGLVPLIASAVAEQKRLVTAVDVARAASENTVKLYGRGIAERALIAVKEAKERAEAFASKLLEQEEEEQKQAAGEACVARVEDEESELAMQQLLEKMAATAVERG
jgi:Tat protein secretion system quality control protein TatD with DNase activity